MFLACSYLGFQIEHGRTLNTNEKKLPRYIAVIGSKMAKKITQLPVKTTITSNDIMVFVDDAFTDENETSYITYQDLSTKMGQDLGVSETTSATYTSANDTIDFLRSNGTRYYATLDHPTFAFDSLRITGTNAPGNGSSLRWNNTVINASEALTTNPVQIRTAAAHPFANSDLVNFTNFTNMYELNNSDYYVKTVNTTAFDLYQDSTLSITLNGTGFGGNATSGTMKLSGSDGYWAPTSADLGGLSDINIDSSLATGDILRYDGTNWNNGNTENILETSSLTDVGNVRTDTLLRGQSLRYNNQQYSISAIAKQNPCLVTTVEDHNVKAGDPVTFAGIGGMTQLNSVTAYAGVPHYINRTFQLYIDSGLNTPLDSSLYSNYTSGGVVDAGTGQWVNKGFYQSGEIIQTKAHILDGIIIEANSNSNTGGTGGQVSFTPKSSTSTVIFEYNTYLSIYSLSNIAIENHHVGFWLYDHTNSAVVDCNNALSANNAESTNGDTPHTSFQITSQFGNQATLRFVYQNTAKVTRTFGLSLNNSGGHEVPASNPVRRYVLGSTDTSHPISRVNASKPTLTITEIAN